MTRTAYQEYYGCSALVDFSADYRLPLPSGEGGCRFFTMQASDPGLLVMLPDATKCQPGGGVAFLVYNQGAEAFDLVDRENNGLVTISGGEAYEVRLLSNTGIAGTWVTNLVAGLAEGTPMTIGRTPLRTTIASTGLDLDLRDFFDQQGYDGATPAALHVTIGAGYVRGATSTAAAGMDSGTWPAGSTLLLVVEAGASIAGVGGDGGSGGQGQLPANASSGLAGGPGLILRLNTALVSYGYVQGGGGGGGGGAGQGAVGGQAGGGGGGGAGHSLSAGGLAGQGGGGSPGYSGSLFVAGGGGAGFLAGGTGGAPGAAGSPGGGTAGGMFGVRGEGGAAGDAIRKLTGITLTKIRAGTIQGAEVFF